MNDKVNDLMKSTEETSNQLDTYREDLIKKYTEPLDECIKKINSRILSANGDLEIPELNRAIQELIPLLYYAASGMQIIGTRCDASESLRLDIYNKARDFAKGAQQEKDAYAQSQSVDEKMVADLMKRAYKELENKVNEGHTVFDGLRKVLDIKSKELQFNQAQERVLSGM